MPEARVTRAAELFALLSSPTRLAIVLLLRGSSRPVRLAKIKAEVAPEALQSAFSLTLKSLVISGLVSRAMMGQEALFELAPGAREKLEPLLNLIDRPKPRK